MDLSAEDIIALAVSSNKSNKHASYRNPGVITQRLEGYNTSQTAFHKATTASQQLHHKCHTTGNNPTLSPSEYLPSLAVRRTGARTRESESVRPCFFSNPLQLSLSLRLLALSRDSRCMIFQGGHHHLCGSQVVLLPSASLCPGPAQTFIHTRGSLLLVSFLLYLMA